MAPTICAICKEPANAKCTRCRSAVYCSRACQKMDFPLHKLLCSKIGIFVEEKPRLSDLHYLALLFHEKSNLPRLVWVEANDYHSTDDKGNVIECWDCSLGVEPYMSGCSGWPIFPSHNPHNIQIYAVDSIEHEGNQCLSHLTDGYATRDISIMSVVPYDWSGPRVVLGFAERNVEGVLKYRDITLNDLRAALDDVSTDLKIFDSGKSNPFVVLDGNHWTKAVKVSCTGDQEFLGKATYRQVEIKKDHPIFFAQDDTSTISKSMGFTLLAKKCEFDPAWVLKLDSKPYFDPFSNRHALQILINVDPSDENECWSRVESPKWDIGKDPTVLFAREDQNDVTVHQIAALSSYCENVVWDKMNYENDQDEEKRTAFVQKYASAEAFKTYFARYCQKRCNLGEEGWVDAKPPASANKQGVMSDMDRRRYRAMHFYGLDFHLDGWDNFDRVSDAVEEKEESEKITELEALDFYESEEEGDENIDSGGMELDESDSERNYEHSSAGSLPGSPESKRRRL